MLTEELKKEMPTIVQKTVGNSKKVVTVALAVNDAYTQLNDLQNDFSIIFPKFEEFFKNNMQKLMEYVVQLFGLGPINILLY
jgi:hypothetical protein